MSKRHPASRKRIQDPHDHDPDDVFIAKALEVSEWARAHVQFLWIVGILLVIGVASGLYYRNYRHTLTQQAAQQLEDIHQSIALQDAEGARQALVTFLQRFGNTPYAGEARLLLGDLYLEGDQPQQAIAVLEPVGRDPKDPLELQAGMLLAAAYEQHGQAEEAEATYLKVADRSDLDFQVREALSNAARIRAARDDAEGAIALYQRILAGMEDNDPARGVYEMRVEELKVSRNT